jgi:hypothetical protein
LINYFKLITFFFLFCLSKTAAQQLHLSILAYKNTKIIDSIGYKKIHTNAKSILDETNLVAEKLSKVGFLECRIVDNKKLNDSTFVFHFDLGKQTKYIHIYGSPNLPKAKEGQNDTLIIPYNKVEDFLNSNLQQLEKQGFGLSKLQLVNIQKKKNYLIADLKIVTNKKRNINDFVIKGYDKFPLGYKKSLERKYRNQVFNQDNLKKINADFNKIRFVKQTKYPEILFTTDSTKVFVYLEKAKTNTFDGFIGFSNDEKGRLIFNGYVDLALNNALNVGEKLALYWKSDGKDQKTFNGSVEIPYIFNSPVAVKTQLNIFKQDSIYQNTKTAIDVGYYLNYNSKIYLGYQSTESNDIKNTNSSTISDYNNSYYTGSYEFIDYNNDDFLFPEKTNFEFKIGTGKRDSKRASNKQFFGSLFWNYHLYLSKKTAVNLKTQNFYLHSDSYIVNELARFGGINSIRGFNENSLQANSFASIITEYQYIISPSLYLHSILDYGYFQDKTANASGKLFGLGIGFGLQTKNGLLNFVYANGSASNQSINSSNSIVHISLKTVF